MPIISRAAAAIAAGALIVSISMGIRHSFGLFLTPMSNDLGAGREAFAFALALQNILWGLCQPLTGAIADRFGSARVIFAGGVAYAAGLLVMAGATNTVVMTLGVGVLIGVAMSALGFAVVLGAIGRAVPASRRSLAFGIASAGGSFGQFAMAPIGQELISAMGWSQALMALAVLALAMTLFAAALKGRNEPDASAAGRQSLGAALAEAYAHSGYRYLTAGYFVCGFQVAFVAVHLPAYLTDLGLPAATGATALALIGLFNIVGTFAAGALGDRHSKKYLLSAIYFLRACVFAAFLVAPKTELTVLLFAGTLGLLWLGTVPLTTGLVAQIFGLRYVATLSGIVFLSHQLGSFIGVWWAGRVFDATRSYDPMWIAAVVLGVAAALVHLPIVEKPLRAPA